MPDPSTLPVELPKIRAKVLGDQLVDRLNLMPGRPVVKVYRGEITGALPVRIVGGQPDKSGRVDPYVVVFDGTGTDEIEAGLARVCDEQLRWTPGVTIGAGFSEDCIQTYDRVKAWLRPWRPVLADVSAGFLTLPDGYDPGPPRPDRTVAVPRFFIPLQFRLDLTT